MRLDYFKQLDGVRAIAALMVMFFHFFAGLTINGPLHALPHYAVFGQTGVSLFFVLSGFLITRILLATKESPRYFTDFYIRRALRIFPLYYFFLIIFFYITPAILHTPSVPAYEQFYFWIYLQNFASTFHWSSNGPSHYWSLAVEEHFYLVWPLLVFYLNKKTLKMAVAMILLIALASRLILTHKGLPTFYSTFTRMDELALGGLLSIWELEGKLKNSAKKFALGFVLMLIPTIGLWVKVTGKGIDFVQVIKFDLLAISYFCLVGFIVSLKETNLIHKILAGKFFTFTGRISYGLYVYHPLVFIILGYYCTSLSALPLFLVSVGATYGIAILSFYFFEAKFTVLKKYFAYDRAPIPVDTAIKHVG